MYNDLNLCEACLSKDRKLVCIDRIRPLIVYLDIKELTKSQGYICWECYTIIIKFNKFRCIAREVQDILAKQSENIKSYSQLDSTIIKYYDFNLVYTKANIHENLTTEPILIKQEPEDDSDGDESVFVDVIDCKNEDLTTKSLTKERYNTKKNTSEFDNIMLINESVDINELSKDNSEISYEKVTKRLTKKTLKDIEELIDIKESKAKDNSDLSEKDKVPKRIKETSHKKEVPTERLTSKRKERKLLDKECLTTKRLKDTTELSNKFEMVILNDEEVLKSREEKRNHHNYKKLPYKCDYCVLGFTKKDNYDLHMATKHDESKGKPCEVCGVRFSNLIILQNHKQLHYQYFKCKLCEYKGNTHMAIVNHVMEKHKNDSTDNIHCKLCTKSFGNRDEISEHMRVDHTLFCNDCGEKFKSKGNLRLHLKRLHTVKREFVCADCKKTFLTKSRLETHMTRHSTTLAKTLAYCTICHVQYKDLAIYRNHLKNSVNHVQDKFPCPDCDKKFASKAYWKKHYNFYHLKKSQHKCDECDKIFMSYFLLKGHRQKYHGLSRPRNHICSVCQKSFYNNTNLRAHMQIHSSHRAYMCAKCGDTFKQRPALYTHQRLVHNDTKSH